jgi:Ca-activated chloride channel family protein
MNREQAETLLAAMVADELDEPQRGDLLAYLKTDPAMAERVGDMRLAARLLREGLEAASADAPTALADAQRAELLALAEREPIEADAPAAETKSGFGPLFSIRIAGGIAACFALGIGLLGAMLPELGDARRTARRMQNTPDDAYAYDTYGEYGLSADDIDTAYVVPTVKRSEAPGLGDMPMLGAVQGRLREDNLATLLDRSESSADLAGGTQLDFDYTDGHVTNRLLDEVSGSLAQMDGDLGPGNGYNNNRSQASADKTVAGDRWSGESDDDMPAIATAKPTDPAAPAESLPPAPPSTVLLETDPLVATGPGVVDRPDLGDVLGIAKQSGLAQAGDWSGSIVWNDNMTGLEGDNGFDTKYSKGTLNTGGQQGQQSAGDLLFSDSRDSNGVVGTWGSIQTGQDAPVTAPTVVEPSRYDDFAKDLGNKVDLRRVRQLDAPDEVALGLEGLPVNPAKPGGVTFSIEVPEPEPMPEPSIVDAEDAAAPIPDSLAFGPSEPSFDALREQLEREGTILPGYAGEQLAEQLELVPQFNQAPGFDLNSALSNSSSGGGGGGSGSGNAPLSDLMIQARANTAAQKAEQAEQALRAGQLNAAVQLYEDATLLDPDNPSNQTKLAEAKARLDEQMRPLGLLDKSATDRVVDRGAAIAEYEKAMAKATASLEKQDFQSANNAIIEARTILSRERGVIDTGDYNARVDRANQLLDLTKTTQSRVSAEQMRRIELERGEIEQRIASETERRTKDELQARLRKARALQLEKNYDQALVELDAALFLEPDNAVIKAMRGMIQDTSVAVDSFDLKRQRDLEIASQTLLNIEATTPFADILTYPGDWPELTAGRLRGLEDDKKNAVVNEASRAALGKTVAIPSENMTLGSVVDYVRDTTGANVAVNWPALELTDVTRDTPITVAAKQVSADQLLKSALDQATKQQGEKLAFVIDEGVVKISTREDLRPTAETRVYDIRTALSRSSELSQEQRISQIIERVKASVGEPKRWIDEQYTIQELNGNLIVRTTPDSHVNLARVIDQLNGEANAEAQAAAPPKVMPVNPWVLTEQDAQSTFALDTDTASYDLARRTIIQQAKLPPIASVRMEEFVNRFDYQYPSGRDAHDTFTVHAEAGSAPFAGSGGSEAVLLKVGVRGRVVARDQMKPAHYVFVIDASGSMAREDRLPLVQRSLAMLLGQLGEHDTVSLVSYETRPFLLLEHASASDPQTIMNAAATIQTGGSTNLTDGLKLGYQVASRHFAPGSVNRVILCSDGVANVGDDDAKEMLEAVKAYRQHGVTLMTVGVGVDGQTAGAASGDERYNDGLMEQLANQGDGQYVYLGSVQDAKRQFVTDLAATRPTIAYDAKIQVHFDPTRVRRYRLIGYENRDIADKDFRNDAVDAGEVGSGQSATALYEVELWPTRRRRAEDTANLGTVYVRYRDARSGAIEETQTALSAGLIEQRTIADHPRFYLAACAAEFAELLRESEHASDGSFTRLHRIAQEVAEALPLDKDAAELAELIGRADGLPRAGQ